MPSTEDADVVVLAGGGSRRFDGGRKALATVGGQPLLARVLDVGTAITETKPIIAVAGREQRELYADVLDRSVRFVTDPPGEAGPLAGLRSAVEAADARWLFVLGCDMPLVEQSAIDWLASKRGADVAAVIPQTADGTHPIHAWYRREALQQALKSEVVDRSVHSLIECLSVTIVAAADAPETVPLERSVCNVNTRADLGEVRRLIEE